MPPIFSQVVICPIRFSVVAILAMLLATSSPIATDASVIGGEAFTRMYFDDVLPGQNLSTVQNLIAPGAVLTTPEGIYEGELGVLEFLDTLSDSFTQVQFTPTDYVTGDDAVTVRFTLSGYHTGPYLGLPARCAAIAVEGVAILNFSGEGISDQWFTYDRQSLVAQIVAMDGLDQHTRPLCDIDIAEVPATEPPQDCVRRDRCDVWS
jgi:predicted ester cyclase